MSECIIYTNNIREELVGKRVSFLSGCLSWKRVSMKWSTLIKAYCHFYMFTMSSRLPILIRIGIGLLNEAIHQKDQLLIFTLQVKIFKPNQVKF